MTLAGQAAAFALGVALSIRMIAALYAIVDLWCAIGAHYPRVVRGILGWGLTIAGVLWILDPPYRAACVSGLLAFLTFYLSLYMLRHPVLRAAERRSRAQSTTDRETAPRRPGDAA